MNKTKEILDDLRQGIDQIDDQLIALLRKRASLVREVGRRKQATGNAQSFMRPGREATMLRNLMQKIGDDFPKGAIAAIWRMIISGSLSLEQSMGITAYCNDSDATCYWLAREYFGSFLPIQSHENAKEIAHDIMAGNCAAGVIPSPLETNNNNCWWLENGKLLPEIPHIFACIPFVTSRNDAPFAFGIAHVTPEPTGDDLSFIALTIDETCSQAHIVEAFTAEGTPIKTVKNFPDFVAKGKKHFVIEAHGFYTKNDPKLDHIANALQHTVDEITVLGAYAAPTLLKA